MGQNMRRLPEIESYVTKFHDTMDDIIPRNGVISYTIYALVWWERFSRMREKILEIFDSQ